MFSSLEITIERLRIPKLAALLRDVGPYAAIELLLPGGSLIALGLWLYSRHKSGKPLLPFRLRRALASAVRASIAPLSAARASIAPFSAARRLRASSRPAVRKLSGLDLLDRRLRSRDERSDVPVAGVAFGG
jgi:hypothetical protein